MVDTCCDPTPIDYVIPANDDAAKSIEYITDVFCKAIQEGLDERKLEKEKADAEQAADESKNVAGKKLRARKGAKPIDVEAEAAKIEEAPAKEAPKAEVAEEVKEAKPAKKAAKAPKAEAPVEEAPKAE
jgi:small subunit ribosomal protein S2